MGSNLLVHCLMKMKFTVLILFSFLGLSLGNPFASLDGGIVGPGVQHPDSPRVGRGVQYGPRPVARKGTGTYYNPPQKRGAYVPPYAPHYNPTPKKEHRIRPNATKGR